jgi:HD superfamily phosphodiesterase
MDLFNRVRAELISSDLDQVWNHTKRVIKNLFIIKGEGCDFDLKKTIIAAIIHDIGYIKVIEGHERVSTQIMKTALDKMWDHQTINEVCHIVESHQFNGAMKPQTNDAMALHDADILDFSGEKGIINLFKLLKNLGMRDSDVANWINDIVKDGFALPIVKKNHLKELKQTENFFLNFVKDLSKERIDFKKYGMDNV